MSRCINFVIVISRKEKYRAHVIRVYTNNNLLNTFRGLKEVVIIHYFSTRYEAIDVCKSWNKSYKDNGTFLELIEL